MRDTLKNKTDIRSNNNQAYVNAINKRIEILKLRQRQFVNSHKEAEADIIKLNGLKVDVGIRMESEEMISINDPFNVLD